MAAKDFKALFESDSFVSQYRTGEKITGTFAKCLISQSGILTEFKTKSQPDRPLVVLDNACGTGVVSSILHHELDEHVRKQWTLTCGDISEGMLKYTRARVEEEGWLNVEVKSVDAQETGLPSGQFTYMFTAFGTSDILLQDLGLILFERSWHFLSHRLRWMVSTSIHTSRPTNTHMYILPSESLRILQPGGTIAFSTWIEPGWVSVMKKAIATMPGNLPFPTAEEFLSTLGDGQWNSVPWIESQLQQRGFTDINVKADTKHIPLTTKEVLDSTMMMFSVITQKFWTAEQREQHEAKVRPALARYLEEQYGEDGVVPMDWVAILSTARKAC
ncbi:hypothetical protein N7510_009805 [Penicillium lagena]|uniref:uncharacterized protein n=1 Tax=Penicillium lagena TaxID=94218 RepID=UPI00253FF33C|nr:uncharacterized protein N7510_009805 [Penicillium lagena]KAJ5604651.1 hypothetical protein N7510_009805 [Penicillium lagena]